MEIFSGTDNSPGSSYPEIRVKLRCFELKENKGEPIRPGQTPMWPYRNLIAS